MKGTHAIPVVLATGGQSNVPIEGSARTPRAGHADPGQ